MKQALRFIFLAALLLSATIPAFAQGSLYTRKAKLEDFPTKTLKVVAGGQSLLEIVLRDEVSSRWRISPFEFCTESEYMELKDDNSYYFLQLGEDEGVAFLVLGKGGKEEDEDNLKRPFELVRIPIASIGDPDGRELMYMGAFIDVLQGFVEDSMISDRIAYTGLKHYNKRSLAGKRVYVNTEETDTIFDAETRDAVIGIVIAPTTISFDSYCYKMLLSTDTHELYYFKKLKYRGSKDMLFSKSEKKKFGNRNGVVPL